jgi:hypothetical protein
MAKNKNPSKCNFLGVKQPRAIAPPKRDKAPRAAVTPNEHCQPDFRTDLMDLDGQWHWNNISSLHLQDLLQKIFHSQKLTWQTLREHGSHLVNISELIPEAQKRLIDLKQDDLDELYSLRLSGQKRVWGIKENNILWLLWWDPLHSICPSIKKHT